MRESGLRSIGPNFSKSIFGQGSTFRPPVPAPGDGAPTGAGVANARLTCCCTSSRVTRPLGPLPETPCKFTPSSRAKRRIAGLACTVTGGPPASVAAVFPLVEGGAGATIAASAGAGRSGSGDRAGACLAFAGADGEAPTPPMRANSEP